VNSHSPPNHGINRLSCDAELVGHLCPYDLFCSSSPRIFPFLFSLSPLFLFSRGRDRFHLLSDCHRNSSVLWPQMHLLVVFLPGVLTRICCFVSLIDTAPRLSILLFLMSHPVLVSLYFPLRPGFTPRFPAAFSLICFLLLLESLFLAPITNPS